MSRPDLKALLIEKAVRFQRVFGSPEGIKVLADLKEELDRDNIHTPGDSHSTSYNLGRRDAYIYITQLLRFKNERQSELEG